jgi:amino acid adenylation domain-containing protein
LHQLSRSRRSTLFMTLLAAFQVLLARYCNQTDIAVGTPVANRTRLEIEPLIGFFVNTLVLRTGLGGNPTFEQLLERVRQVCLEAYANQDVPFERLVSELQPARDLSRTPLFQVMFSLQNAALPAPEMSGLKLTRFSQPEGVTTTNFDLILGMAGDEQSLAATLDYNSDLFDDATIARMIEHFVRVLEAMTSDTNTRIQDIALLGLDERRRITLEWNATAGPFPDQCIHQLLDAHAVDTPTKPAVRLGADSVTYRELAQRVERIAHGLRTAGAKPGVRIGLCLERSIEMVACMLGVLKTGAAYIPLDPGFPRERIAYMIEDSGMQIVIAEPGAQDFIAAGIRSRTPRILHPETLEAGLHLNGDPAYSVSPLDTAYIMYTSGSTGRPKAAQISHRSVVNFLHSMRSALAVSSADIVLSVTTPSFDIAGLETFLPLAVGAELVLAPAGVPGDGRSLGELIASSSATLMQATPATWRLLRESGWRGSRSLRTILCGGEALARDLADALLESAEVVWNMYGPTETTIWSSMWRVEPGSPLVPIGRPILNTTMYILDRGMQPVPIGVPGELYIGGEGVAAGYLNRPELTAEKFVPDPFAQGTGARLYFTGDQARFLADGNIHFLGRTDQQLKLRGHRIEPGEIETALNEHPAVERSVIVVHEDAPGDQRLIAYITSREYVADASLRAHLKERLPAYMIPAAFVPLEAFPLTPNGKLDRRGLKPPPRRDVAEERVVHGSGNAIERVVLGVWQDVLQISEVGIHDSFFDVGGHSLLLLRVQVKLTEVLGKEISIIDLFRFPTVYELARYLGPRSDGEVSLAGRNIEARKAGQDRKRATRKVARIGR